MPLNSDLFLEKFNPFRKIKIPMIIFNISIFCFFLINFINYPIYFLYQNLKNFHSKI